MYLLQGDNTCVVYVDDIIMSGPNAAKEITDMNFGLSKAPSGLENEKFIGPTYLPHP